MKVIQLRPKQQVAILSIGKEHNEEHELKSQNIWCTSGKKSLYKTNISSSCYLDIVSDSWAMVLLNEIYLKSFNQAKKMLIANIFSDCSVHQLRVSKSP